MLNYYKRTELLEFVVVWDDMLIKFVFSRSAEDLDDNFELDDEHDFMLAYDKDGKPLVPEKVLKDFSGNIFYFLLNFIPMLTKHIIFCVPLVKKQNF